MKLLLTSARLGFLIAIILAAVPYAGLAQVFSNLDFEYGVYKAQPRKWAIEGEGEDYTAWLDSVTSQSGKKSLYGRLRNAQVFIFLSIPGKLIAGKSVQVEGYLKSGSLDSLHAMLMFHNPGGGKPMASAPADFKSNEWRIISHQASFPPDYSSDRLLIALMAQGTGRFWFDHVKIKIDGRDYGIAPPDFREPTKKEIETLNKSIVPVRSLEPGDHTDDLAPLKNMIGSAHIVALGENSHGSSSLYKLKLRMIEHLVENQGFSIFALESPAVEADKINEYVLTGKGTIKDVIRDLVYPSWRTQEMLDIIQWMKIYNQDAKNKKKIAFRGFDMQDGSPALKALEDFARVNDPVLSANLLELDQLYRATENRAPKLIIQKAETIQTYLQARNYIGVDEMYLATLKHYLNIFLQSVSLSERIKSRDEYMAENVDWLVKNAGNDVKIILSADNTHVTKASGKMGYFLRERYGDNYLNVGLTYNSGSYSAYGPKRYYDVHPSFAGTYEYFFSKAKFKNYFLNIANRQDIELLNHPAGFRSIGSKPQETTQFTEINLKDHFDIIGYLEISSHTNSLSE